MILVRPDLLIHCNSSLTPEVHGYNFIKVYKAERFMHIPSLDKGVALAAGTAASS